jgi:hypothetical protein
VHGDTYVEWECCWVLVNVDVWIELKSVMIHYWEYYLAD